MNEIQRTAIKQFFQAAMALENCGVIRSSRFLGDIGEFVAKEAIGVTLSSNLRLRGSDGLLNLQKVEVKFHNSSTRTNLQAGNPSNYQYLVIVLGPNSKLRPLSSNQGNDFLVYVFEQTEVLTWRSARGKYYFSKSKIKNTQPVIFE